MGLMLGFIWLGFINYRSISKQHSGVATGKVAFELEHRHFPPPSISGSSKGSLQ